MHIFQVEMAHRTYGRNWTKYVVKASSARGAIAQAMRLAGPGEFAFEVEHIATLD